MFKSLSIALLSLATFSACAQRTSMDFEQYEPVSSLVVPEHKPIKAKFPFIDVHNHQNGMSKNDLAGLKKDMDAMNMKVMVNLSGGNGSRLSNYTSSVKENYPSSFIVFANVDFDGVGGNNWTEKAVKQLADDVKNGANGLKVFKNLGFSAKDSDGKRVAVDDPRLDPVWDLCGQLHIPVLIHTADPKPFWDEMNEKNERWLELQTHPGRKRGADNPEPWGALIQEQHRMFLKHPKTTFIAAHFGWYPNDLTHLGKILDSMPNVVVEFGAVIAELGRQPLAAKAFFTQYQDRILFGKDSWVPAEYTTYFRVLETNDEYFPYHKKYHAFWRMYGMGLSDDILKKVYYKMRFALSRTLIKASFQKNNRLSQPKTGF